MTIEKAREERRNFYVWESNRRKQGTRSLFDHVTGVDGTPTRYRGTIFLPTNERSFRKQSKPNGKEYLM